MLSKEGLKKLNIQELEGQLREVKSEFRKASQQLSIERQMQLAKTKAIKGKGSKRKKELIEQILKMQRETQRVNAKIAQIKLQAEMPAKVSFSAGKIKIKSPSIRDKVEGKSADMDNAEMWAAIKTYKDNVKRGVIKELNEYDKLSSDERADYAYEMMDNKDYKKYIRLANEKAAKLEADSAARTAERQSDAYWETLYPGF